MATLQEAIAKRKQRSLAESGSLNGIVHEALQAMMPDILEAFSPHIRQYVAQNAERFLIKGEPGKDAPRLDENRVAEKAARLVPRARDGRDADEEVVAKKVLAKIPKAKDGLPGKDAVLDHEVLAKKVAQKLKTDIKLKPEHIEGLDEMMESYWKKVRAQSKSGIMRGGGDTVLAGTGITITRDSVGRSTITAINPGGGLTYLAVVNGTIDNSNTVFIFAKPPTIVVVNGASYINGSGVTISSTTATLDNPAGTGGSVYALG